MGRLIDEDDVKVWLQERVGGYESLHFGGNSRSAELKIIIDELSMSVPTAYDPDRVVEQLEKEKNPIYRSDGSLMGERTVIGIDKAIQIVKGGGVNGAID